MTTGDGSIPLAVMGRFGAWVFAAAGTLGIALVAAPHPAEVNEAGLLGSVGAAYAAAAVLRLGSERLPFWVHPASMAWGSLLVTSAIYFYGGGAGAFVVLYFTVAFAAFYFLTWRQALIQALAIAVFYGAVLLRENSLGAALPPWLVTVGMVLILGVVIRRVRERTDHFVRAARTDPLTGLLNRRGFDDAFQVELERARRWRRSLSVVICDLDYFKDVNDRFGHHVGDNALKRLSALASETTRLIDTKARVGGEEFALLLPDTDGHGAYILAERLRSVVEREFADEGVSLTASLGVATFPTHGQTDRELLKAADQALYAAKALGRNRTVIHSPGLSPSHNHQQVSSSVRGGS